MKKYLLLAMITFSVFLGGSKLVEATPDTTGKDAKTYFNDLVAEAEKEGYIDQQIMGESLRTINYRVTKINREILGAEYDFPAQFYMSYTGVDRSRVNSRDPSVDSGYDYDTYSVQQKLNFVRDGLKGQSQMLFPFIQTRIEARFQWETYGLMDSPVNDRYFNRQFYSPQGFMYAEADKNGLNLKTKQFVYGKDANHFRFMWNPKTESLMYIAMENGTNPDKIMVVRGDTDLIYRLIRVSGELFYFGNDDKQFTVLNEMAYAPNFHESFEAYETYGKRRGFMLPYSKYNANLVIRTDLEDGPNNWVVKEYPWSFAEFEEPYKKARGQEGADPKNFFSGFTPADVTGTGFESKDEYAKSGVKITSPRNVVSVWHPEDNGGKGGHRTSGSLSYNSVRLKSKSENLKTGESLKLTYGFEPTTSYKVPAVDPIADSFKNQKDDYTGIVKWMDAVSGSTGGEIEFFVNDKPVDIIVEDKKMSKYVYKRDGDIAGEFKVKILAENFKPGEVNDVKISIKDSVIIKDPKVKPEEHTSSRHFKVNNRRHIPISYKTNTGKVLKADESMQEFVDLMDGSESETVEVPEIMTEKNYPLMGVEPKSNKNVSLTGNKVTIKGDPSLKDGISVVYKVLEVDATVRMIDANNDKQILKDLVNGTPVSTYDLKELEIGKPIKPYIEAAKIKPVDPLKIDYDYYTLIAEPEYEIKVDGKIVPTAIVPESDFEIVFKYQGEVGIVKVPVLDFGDIKISNNSELKNLLTNDAKDSTVEMYNTVNKSDRRVTAQLEGDIEKKKTKESDPSQVYNGQLRYATSKENDQEIGNSPVEVLKTNAKDNYTKVNLKGSNESNPGMYLNQFPGNYGGGYEGTVVWKIADDITK